ncbi:Gfo/Idh/MocA family protein [Streptomyces sp. NPDC004031]
MTRPYALAVVGLGVISRFYLDALAAAPAACLVAVCDRDPAALAPFDGHATVRGYRDHRELLAAQPALDGVVVTVPNDAHAAVCADFLRAGVPVCVEKPLARTVPEGAELAALSARFGTPLFTAFHRRYNSAVTALAARLARGPAPVEHVTVRYFERIEEHIGRDRWYLDAARCGGGCVADNGPNAFDLVRLLLGDVEVERARIRRDAAGLDRQAVVELRAVSGTARATVELDWSYPGEVKDVRVRLADGTADHADMLAGHHGFKASLGHEYAAILADFTARLAAPTVPAPAPDPGGTAALGLVEAAYRVAVPWPGPHHPAPAPVPAPESTDGPEPVPEALPC